MEQLTISNSTYERILDILDWHIFNTRRRLKQAESQDCLEDEIEILEWDLANSEELYQAAEDETGHTYDAV